MKIAMISSIPATPPTAGNRRRIFGLSHALMSLGHDVYFIHLPSPLSEKADPASHKAIFGENRFIQLPYSSVKSAGYRLSRLPYKFRRRFYRRTNDDKSYYYGLDEFFPMQLEKELQKLHSKLEFDAVICEYVFSSRALNAFPKDVTKIIDTHDSFADRHKLFKNRTSYWYSLPKEEQIRGFNRADAILAIQEAEGQQFSGQLAANGPEVAVVSHFLDTSRPVEDYASPNALFVGSSNAANISSALFFIEQVLPIVRKQIPDFKLVAAGSICNHIDDADGLIKLGIVDELDKAVGLAPLSINPSLTGTGINIKMLEAMSFGIATITSEVGARGLGSEFRNGVIVTEDSSPHTFAETVCRLSSDESLRRRLGRAAFSDAVAWNDRQLTALRSVLRTFEATSGQNPAAKFLA